MPLHLLRMSRRRAGLLTLVAGMLGLPVSVDAQSYELLHSFAGSDGDPALPEGSLIQARDGRLYGTSAAGGTYGDGTVFRMSLNGGIEVMHSFQQTRDGAFPLANVIQGTDGDFYGTLGFVGCAVLCQPMTLRQTEMNPSLASEFRMTPEGVVRALSSHYGERVAFSALFPLRAPFLQASNGNLYLAHTSVVADDPWNRGDVSVRIFPDWSSSHNWVMPPIGGANGPGIMSPLIEATDGNLYGTSSEGGTSNLGTVFTMTLDGVYAILHEFAGGAEGASPRSILQAADGNFYGTTELGGAFNHGTVFMMTPTGLVTVLHAFIGVDGSAPSTPLIQAIDGNFYGTTPRGGTFDLGVAFRMTPDGAVTVMYAFGRNAADGAVPQAALFQANDGNFYGTTKLGGHGIGTVFRMTPAGTVTILASFGAAAEGGTPRAPLLRGGDGNFYGTTFHGGSGDHGTIFRLTPSGVHTVMHIFDDSDVNASGAGPVGGLIQAGSGEIYGTTFGTPQSWGLFPPPNSFGTIFKVTLGGVVTLLHRFAGVGDGAGPSAAVLQTADGNFLGTTTSGGDFRGGTLFRMTPAGNVTVLHSFAGGPNDGQKPDTPLVQASDGNYYGTTSYGGGSAPYGGVYGYGTIFRVTQAGAVTLVHSFQGAADGAEPNGLVQGDDGFLYGTTSELGALGGGTAFRVSVSGPLTTLHAFSDADGGAPRAALLKGADGLFYGTTGGSATFRGGAVFRMTPAGNVIVLAGLAGPDGAAPNTALIQAGGLLYGTCSAGGRFDSGVVFRVNPNVPPLRPATIVRAPGIQGVRLTWASVTAATSYTVKRSLSPGTETVLATGLTSPHFTDVSAVPGHTYYYVVSAINRSGESMASYEVSITPGRAIEADFDGDGKSDATVFRPSTGIWYARESSTGTGAFYQWGLSGDIPVPGDYDGDGKTDVAVFRPSTGIWYVLQSSTGTGAYYQWGLDDDVPVPGDYDGDGKTDVAVFRPSTGFWYILQSRSGTGAFYQWGLSSDIPVPGDYDGDGKTDVAVFRPSTGFWYIRQSSTGTGAFYQWGLSGDLPVPGDYDGDGKTDVAVFRPSTGVWYVLHSSTVTGAFYKWGLSTDIPVPGDYDGDGITDVAVFRPSTGIWSVLQSSTGTGAFYQWGLNGDLPIPRVP